MYWGVRNHERKEKTQKKLGAKEVAWIGKRIHWCQPAFESLPKCIRQLETEL